MRPISFFLLSVLVHYSSAAQQIFRGNVHILYTPDHPANRFTPSQIIGGAIDGHESGEIDQMLSEKNIHEMLTAGLKPVSYRLRTELAGEAWHWNPVGRWSDSAQKQGYWISDSVSSAPIQISYGFRLPRRGNTFDQANNDSYSRITDGDTSTFWKSNPYLDEYFTKEPNKLHPQWVIIDMGGLKEINCLRIKWAKPYATRFSVDYAPDIGSDYFDPYQPGLWHPFEKKDFKNPLGANQQITLSDGPVKARFIRISMQESSHNPMGRSKDIRDRCGFAIKEIEAGLLKENGLFRDWIRHSANHKQTTIYVSSTDPWHSEKDLDLEHGANRH